MICLSIFASRSPLGMILLVWVRGGRTFCAFRARSCLDIYIIYTRINKYLNQNSYPHSYPNTIILINRKYSEKISNHNNPYRPVRLPTPFMADFAAT